MPKTMNAGGGGGGGDTTGKGVWKAAASVGGRTETDFGLYWRACGGVRGARLVGRRSSMGTV